MKTWRNMTRLLTMVDVKQAGYLKQVRLHRMPGRRAVVERATWQRLEEY